MTLKAWVLARIRDDDKHAEIALREQRTIQMAEALQGERSENGFGLLFAKDAGLGSPNPRKHRRKHA